LREKKIWRKIIQKKHSKNKKEKKIDQFSFWLIEKKYPYQKLKRFKKNLKKITFYKKKNYSPLKSINNLINKKNQTFLITFKKKKK
jgi:hypothetical protein